MAYTVVFAPEAEDQLEELYLYIANQASSTVAERYTGAVVSCCEGLSLFPHRGVPREDIRPGLRLTNYKGRTVIAFAVDDVPEHLNSPYQGETQHLVSVEIGAITTGYEFESSLRGLHHMNKTNSIIRLHIEPSRSE